MERIMKYTSSLTKGIKLATLLLLLFWVVNSLVIINSNGIRDAMVFSLLMFGFVIAFILVFVSGIYITVANNNVKYVHMFLLRTVVEIGKIHKLEKSLMGGLYKSLSLIYEDNGKVKDIKISTLTFNNDTLKQFVSDLKKQNPQIDVDQSATDLIS
jgi:hypothetical protein